jgi:hypothetical protein
VPARSALVVRVLADGRALADATVTLSSGGVEGLRREASALDGRVSFSGLSPGGYRLVVEHSNFVTQRRELVLEGTLHTLEVALAGTVLPSASSSARPSRSVRGRVISPTGDPIAGASVGSGAPGSNFATTDRDGAFVLNDVGDSPLQVFATAPGYAAKHRRGVAPGSQDLTIELELPTTVRGALAWPQGAERVDVSVCHYDEFFRREICIARRTYRPPSDSYEVPNLPSGDYELVVEADGFSPSRFPLRLSAGTVLDGPQVALHR